MYPEFLFLFPEKPCAVLSAAFVRLCASSRAVFCCMVCQWFFNMLTRLKCAPILFLKTVCRFATFLTRLFVFKRLLFLFRKSLPRRFADCDFCVVSGVLRDEARTCLANAHTLQSVLETPVIPYMKPFSDNATRSASPHNRRGRPGEKRA